MKSTNQTPNSLAKQNPLQYKVIPNRIVTSTYCFCFLFLENMTPMRPRAAKPTPAMPAAMTTSLTCNRRRGESDSMAGIAELAVHSTGPGSSGHLKAPWPPLTKFRNQQMLAGKSRGQGWMEKTQWVQPAGLDFTESRR